jgi:predicted nucleic acid-binding protein
LVAARALLAERPDQQIGLSGAASVVLADRFATDVIAALDRRRFSTLSVRGKPVRIIP